MFTGSISAEALAMQKEFLLAGVRLHCLLELDKIKHVRKLEIMHDQWIEHGIMPFSIHNDDPLKLDFLQSLANAFWKTITR